MEMNYPTTYMLMKATVCHFMSCKHEGDCSKCEYGLIREQAARDHDVIFGQSEKQEGQAEATHDTQASHSES